MFCRNSYYNDTFKQRMAAPRSKIPIEIRKLIVNLKNEGKSLSEIADIVKRPRSSVQYVIENFKKTKSLETTPGRGRKAKLTDRHHRLIVREIAQNPKLSAPKIADSLAQNANIEVSPQTVRNVLREKGYRGCVARKKSFISAKNLKKRLEYARKYVEEPEEFWNNVIFTDESKFNIFCSDGLVRVWRRPNTELDPKNLRPTVKHGGGSVMVWGAYSAKGPGNLVFIESIMDRFKYLDILKNNLKSSAEKLGHGKDFRFVQDNDPKHSSKLVKEWLLYNVKSTLPHPPQSPDLNPIENLWDHLERKIREHTIQNQNQLKQVITEEWHKISPEVTQKLSSSMKRRLQSVIAAKGGHTKY